MGSLGELEQLLLLGLIRHGGEASGIDLRDTLAERANRTVLPGAVYTIMQRMVDRGWVTAFLGDATPERGGRRRKYYRLMPEGERALGESYQQVARMVEGLEPVLERIMEDA